MPKLVFTFVLTDGPNEHARCRTAFRLVEAAIRRGHDVKIVALEDAIELSSVKRSITWGDERWIPSAFASAKENGCRFEWINCGPVPDQTIEGVRQGGPADLWRIAEESDNALVVPRGAR